MFIGRERELNSLNELYHKNGFRMTVLLGRRRVGKSTLIAEFIRDKRAIYYTAARVGGERNRELFAGQVLQVLDPAAASAKFPSTDELFAYMAAKWPEEPLVLVIDEFPYWAEKDEGLLSILQKYIDTAWQNKNMMLILCGSSLSFMEMKVLSEKSPLFGRRDSQIRLAPFDYRESALFVPDYSPEEKALCYGVTGGVAKYLSLFDPSLDFGENVKRLFFRPDGYLYDEPRNLLVQEFTEITMVNNIIEQIANGENTLSLIADKVHESPSAVSYALNRLQEVELVEKRHCILEEKNKKKIQYVLKDGMLRFWYAFIPKAASLIEMGAGEAYYDRAVAPRLHGFMGPVFEEMCRRFTLEQGCAGRFGCFLTDAGSWWGMEPAEAGARPRPTDIDVVGISDTDRALVAGECKFRNEKMDRRALETLRKRAALLPARYETQKYLLFSLGGFTAGLSGENGDRVLTFTLEDLYSR